MTDQIRRDAAPPTTLRLLRTLEAALKNLPPSRTRKYLTEATVDAAFDEALSHLLEHSNAAHRRRCRRLEKTLISWKTASRRALEKAARTREEATK